MGSIGRTNTSYDVRELERRLEVDVRSPRHAQRLIDDIMNRLAMTEEPGYDPERREADRNLLNELLRRIRRGDYGEDTSRR